MGKNKICVFCSLSSFNTGMPISTYKLAAGLAASGRYDVFAVLPQEGELGDRLKAASVSVEVIPFCRFRTRPVPMLKFMLSYLRAGFRLFKFIRKGGIGIVHFSDIIDAPFYPWARLAGAKAVGHVRVCAGGIAVRCIFRAWANIFCSRIVAVSRFVKRYYGFGRKASVVYNPGPDRKIFAPGRYKKTAGGDAGAAVIAVSSFRRDKGLHNFIEIASRVKAGFPGGVKFMIVGGKVPGHEKYYEEMMGEIKREGLDGCLTVTGNVRHEEVAAYMAGAAVLVHAPDWEEALGGVALEAMAMGAAVVACDCGGVGECFTNGVSGFLVKRGDVAAAAEKIVALLESSEARQKTALAARAELDARFTMENYIGGMEKIYEDIINRGGTR
jgi:glycosyltransferase involved in cell wall biosynthesis